MAKQVTEEQQSPLEVLRDLQVGLADLHHHMQKEAMEEDLADLTAEEEAAKVSFEVSVVAAQVVQAGLPRCEFLASARVAEAG